MKVGSALAAFALFGKSNAISLSPDASVESQNLPCGLGDDGINGSWEYIDWSETSSLKFDYKVGSSLSSADQLRLMDCINTSLLYLDIADNEDVDNYFWLNEPYKQAIIGETKKVVEENAEVTLTAECASQTQGVSAYQWMVQYDFDKYVGFPYIACRSSTSEWSSFFDSPKCPLQACLDKDCTKCKDDWGCKVNESGGCEDSGSQNI